MSLGMSFCNMTITAEEAQDIFLALEALKDSCQQVYEHETDVATLKEVLESEKRYDAIMKRLSDRFDLLQGRSY